MISSARLFSYGSKIEEFSAAVKPLREKQGKTGKKCKKAKAE